MPYPEAAELLGGVPVVVACTEGSGRRRSCWGALSPRSKWPFPDMPGNPSETVHSEKDLRALGEALARHPQALVLCDEICEHIVLDGRPFVSFGKACPGLRDRSRVVNGVSKACAVTGWRIGRATGPAPLRGAMNTVQSQSVTSVCSIAQAATVAARGDSPPFIERFSR